MTLRTIARRYAAALFDVAQKRGDPGQLEPDLQAFLDLVRSHPELARAFENPAIPAEKKRALVDALLSKTGDLNADVRRLLLMLAERDRLKALPEIVAAYAERLLQARRIVTAEVTTTSPLPAADRSALVTALEKAAGSDVIIAEKVDPSIVGGLIARVGTLVFDGSVVTQIERMRRKLLQES